MTDLPRVSRILSTPDNCFAGITDFPYTPRYTEVGGLRIAHVEAGPADGPVVLLMHGEPTWSYLYRHMIPPLAAAGLRVVAPDLVGFGRSDKPARAADHSYLNQVRWMSAWLEAVDLRGVTLFCQDWGSLIGLRMVVEHPDRFARIALGNGGLPTGLDAVPRAFHVWRAFARWSPWFPIGRIVRSGCAAGLPDAAVAAYEAPFPTRAHRVATRVYPTFVPISPADPECQRNQQAWAFFERWERPFLTLFSTRDPITRGGERPWEKRVPGAQGQPHQRIRGAGHFLQEDKGPEVAAALAAFVGATGRH